MCFEILGFDVLIDEKLKPWLIEINHAPSFSTDTPLDFKMKKDIIADAILLLGMTYNSKKKVIKSHKSNINKRMLGGKRILIKRGETKKTSENLSPKYKDDDARLKASRKSPTKRDRDNDTESCSEDDEEEKHHNQYRLIYPTEKNTEAYYEKFITHSQNLYEQFTGSYSKKKTEETNPKVQGLAKTEPNKKIPSKAAFPMTSPIKIQRSQMSTAYSKIDSGLTS
jgi:hypothetical protein